MQREPGGDGDPTLVRPVRLREHVADVVDDESEGAEQTRQQHVEAEDRPQVEARTPDAAPGVGAQLPGVEPVVGPSVGDRGRARPARPPGSGVRHHSPPSRTVKSGRPERPPDTGRTPAPVGAVATALAEQDGCHPRWVAPGTEQLCAEQLSAKQLCAEQLCVGTAPFRTAQGGTAQAGAEKRTPPAGMATPGQIRTPASSSHPAPMSALSPITASLMTQPSPITAPRPITDRRI